MSVAGIGNSRADLTGRSSALTDTAYHYPTTVMSARRFDAAKVRADQLAAAAGAPAD
jgi:hypothetical protein